MSYIRSRVESSKPDQVLYNITDHPGGETIGTVIVDRNRRNWYFDIEGREIPPVEQWRLTVIEWRKQNPGIWP